MAEAGFVANTCGWTTGDGYELLLHDIGALRADVVLVVGDERLYNELRRSLSAGTGAATDNDDASPPPSVVYVPRSGGVQQRSSGVRRQARANRIKQYFYGPDNSLAPHASQLLASDIVLLRVGGGPQAPSSALPIGAQRRVDPAQYEEVAPDASMTNSIAAVVLASEREQVDDANVAGFVFIQEVIEDEKRPRIKILAPCAGPLPSKFLLVSSSLKWLES